jgi:hypothetical protein
VTLASRTLGASQCGGPFTIEMPTCRLTSYRRLAPSRHSALVSALTCPSSSRSIAHPSQPSIQEALLSPQGSTPHPLETLNNRRRHRSSATTLAITVPSGHVTVTSQ